MAKKATKGKMPTYGTGKGTSPTNVVAGSTTSKTQKPMPGPTSPGQPVAMKKALARKAPRAGGTA